MPYRRPSGFVLKPRLAYGPEKRYRWEFSKVFAVLLAEAKVPAWVTPHVLRHTFASLAAQAGISLYKIGTWMGHSSTEVTEIYAHLAAYDPDINRITGKQSDPPPTAVAPLSVIPPGFIDAQIAPLMGRT